MSRRGRANAGVGTGLFAGVPRRRLEGGGGTAAPPAARRRWLREVSSLVLIVGTAACASGGARTAPAPSAGSAPLLTRERIDSLPPAQRREWLRYLDRSARLRVLDQALIRSELAATGLREPLLAPRRASASLADGTGDTWLRSEAARRLGDAILSFQTPSGGWSKRVEYARNRQPGESFSTEKGYIGTFDNGATVEQLEFLASLYAVQGGERFRESFRRGLAYVLQAQFPNGCWPQVYPLQGSYHDAATFNDDAMARNLRLLRDVAAGKYPLAPQPARERAREAVRRGVECVVESQVVVNGRRTAWGAQHDPLTLRPVGARAYEHASLSGGESVDLLEFLMGVRDPEPRVVEAVHAAADWFRETAIHGFEYQPKGALTPRRGAGPIWARFYEIGTNRPIFSNRDGVISYRWEELEPERRDGYSWFRSEAARALQKYDEWAKRHPRRP